MLHLVSLVDGRVASEPGEFEPRPVDGELAGPTVKAPPQRDGAFTVQQVEVPGIEPGSSGVSTGLLRAQLTGSLLGPTVHVSKTV